MKIKVIITGATGMVGEGVMLTCLEHPMVEQVLIVNRRHYDFQHPKLKEVIVPDFFRLDSVVADLQGYDACFFCAGTSSVGMNEDNYTRATYDTTLAFADQLAHINADMTFVYVSGAGTDATGKSRMMWARVKGRTENALLERPFKKVYNFRPAFMKEVAGQKNLKSYYKFFSWMYPVLKLVSPGMVATLEQVGTAMINSVLIGYPKTTLEVKDIKQLSEG
ncbi:NAD-dependent epimerase/dehydratase family protein [Chitinophaga dinghuensis]|uniref:NAD-dependent epimerase/dehydratase family protein n=1 Tax=Chitinophaga dinghuensis TaxID=1539050 RepID=A0A327W866_9BACT|nr:NAD-dependent epimerase/dehydratase family protein [Chitinophaga dinghuensis]RAJ82228.1 NAD-dependent epimerase/dehydratase family protein [Chitinophaga dinghuensis]